MSPEWLDWARYIPDLGAGLLVAIKLTFATIVIAYPCGALLAIAAEKGAPWLAWPTIAVIEICRGVPLLVILYILYQGSPQLGFLPSAWLCAVVGFAISTAAYAAEILRGSIASLPSGQYEAATVVGLSPWRSYLHVILPQAGRVALPALMNLAVIVFQGTSIAYAITLPEVMQKTYSIASIEFDYLGAFLAAALVYAVIVIAASRASSRLEARLSKHLVTR